MVHWFTSWSVSCDDIHVPESYWWSGWKSTFCWSEIPSGFFFFLLLFLFIFKYWLCRNFPMLHKTKTLILNMSIFSLPASVTTISPCCCTMDAVSKAFSLEETKRRSMLKTSIHVVSYNYSYCRSFCFIFSACFDLLSSMSRFVRGTKVNPMHYFTALMTLLKWNLIMIPMVMRNLSSVRSLYTNLYIP